jgi:hypothetical protein
MISIIILFVISILFLTIGKAISDVVSEEDIWRKSTFSKYNIDSYLGCKDYTWKRKYHTNKIINWLLSNPFVFLTDVWHLGNTFQRLGLYLSIVNGILFGLMIPFNVFFICVFIGLYIVFNVIGFHIFYHYLFLKGK